MEIFCLKSPLSAEFSNYKNFFPPFLRECSPVEVVHLMVVESIKHLNYISLRIYNSILNPDIFSLKCFVLPGSLPTKYQNLVCVKQSFIGKT